MKAPDHPADDLLVALYFDDQDGAGEQKRVRQHLHGCEACTWRYTELVAPLERLRTDAASEADEIFTPARLAAQRAAIRERLELGAKATRIIPFPAPSKAVDRAVIGRPVVRWVAAAAAAGLLVGVSAGRFIHTGATRLSQTTQASLSASAVRPVPTAVLHQEPTVTTSDEAFMGEVEAAVARHRIAALKALDDLTPHAREAILARR